MGNLHNDLKLPLPLMLRWRRFVKDGLATHPPRIAPGDQWTMRSSNPVAARASEREIEGFVGRHGGNQP